MATKTEVQSLIDTNLADASNITASEHRAVEGAFVDELYPTPIYDTQATTNVFTKIDNDYTYNFKIAKQGSVVNLSGSLGQSTGGTIGNQNIVTITDTDYLPYAFATDQIIQAFSTSGQVVNLSITGSTIYIVGNTPNNVTFYFNGTYQTVS